MSNWNNFGDPPNKNYEKFFQSFTEIERLPVDSWKNKHFIGYFCKKYYATYNKVFKLSCNSVAPSKCREVHEITRIKYMLSSDPNIIKNYIDWAFETQIIKKKKRVTSLRFLTIDSVITEYKTAVLFNTVNNKIKRDSPLTPDIKDIISLFKDNISSFGEINTFGQLSFLYQCKDQNSHVNKLFEKISDMGFDLNILKEVV